MALARTPIPSCPELFEIGIEFTTRKTENKEFTCAVHVIHDQYTLHHYQLDRV